MRRIDAGFAEWRNPFSGQLYRTSLRPEDVAAIVFWSKNYAPLLPHLPELHRRGYRFLFQFTITGLPRIFEPGTPPAPETVKIARKLADTFGPETVLWRYDPVLVSDACTIDCHRRSFAALARELSGSTTRCYFSFPTFYAKTLRNTAELEKQTGIRCFDPPLEQKIKLASEMADVAESNGMTLLACCNDVLVGGKIQKAHCVDAQLLHQLYPEHVQVMKEKGTRKECGCSESTDIGAYDTCPHGCVYCYANSNKQAALKKYQRHDPDAASLNP